MNAKKIFATGLIAVCMLLMTGCGKTLEQYEKIAKEKIMLEKGDVILFNGDSITDAGRDRSDFHSLAGYPQIVANRIAKENPDLGVSVFNRGISGNRAVDLAGRIKGELNEIKPTVVSILIGINDVWRRYDSNSITSVENFERSYRQTLDAVKAAGVRKIILLEPFLIPTTVVDRSGYYEDLTPKILVIRQLAREYGAAYMPLDGIFAEKSMTIPVSEMSGDGVHLTNLGNEIVADEWLKRML